VALRPSGAPAVITDEAAGGLYQTVEGEMRNSGWLVAEGRLEPSAPGEMVQETRLVGPNGAEGRLVRAYDPMARQLELISAFFDPDLPRWIDAGAVPLVSGRGTPTIAFFTMRQMRAMGIDYGSLRSVKMSTIQNVEAICQLHWLLSKQVPIEQA